VVVAIQTAARDKALPQFEGQLRNFEVRLTTDSLPGGRRISLAEFPRMPVVDAVAKPDNPLPEYPTEEKQTGVQGNAVLRFIVDRDGEPIPETVMVVRGTTRGFVTAGLAPAATARPLAARGRGIDVTSMPESITALRDRGLGCRFG
jgi:hypothetical protein